ncbi:hypothetical protein EBZ37_12930, partial [bacterium]|nr:hypothetical protein [bacterium]
MLGFRSQTPWIVACFSLVFCGISHGKPIPLIEVLDTPGVPTKKGKKSKKPTPKLIEEYRLFGRAREAVERKGTVGSIEGLQKELLLSRLKFENRPIEKEFDELFYALELKKGAQYAKQKNSSAAMSSFQRGLSGLGAFKWPYYWRTEFSEG